MKYIKNLFRIIYKLIINDKLYKSKRYAFGNQINKHFTKFYLRKDDVRTN